jgi:hypothetical protein
VTLFHSLFVHLFVVVLIRISFGIAPRASASEVLTSVGIPSRTLERSDPVSKKVPRRKRKQGVATQVSVSGALVPSGTYHISIGFILTIMRY